MFKKRAPAYALFGGMVVVLAVAALAAGQDDLAAANRLYRAAVDLQQGEHFGPATQAWEKFLAAQPRHALVPQARLNLGLCRLKANQFPEAVATLRDVVQRYPDSPLLETALLCLGMAEYAEATSGDQPNRPKLADAVKTFDTLLGSYPRGKHHAAALQHRALCDEALGDRRAAENLYARLAADHPTDSLVPDALYALGVIQEESGRFQEAGKTYDRFLQGYPNDPRRIEVVMRRAETLFGVKQYKAAAEWFAYAAARPGFESADRAVLRQADSLAALGQHAEASKLFAGFAARFPRSPLQSRAALSGGRCACLAGELPRARAMLEASLAAGGSTGSEAAHWLARTLLKQNLPAEALSTARKALESTPDDSFAPELLLDAADAMYDLPQRRGESVAAYVALARKYPDSPTAEPALYMAATASLSLGRYDAALKQVDEFVDFVNRHGKEKDSKLLPDALAVAAECRLRRGDCREALEVYGKLIADFPRHAGAESWRARQAAALLQIAESQFHDKKFSQAAVNYYAAAGKTNDVSLKERAGFNLAWCYFEQKKLDEARRTFRHQRDQYPQGKLAGDATFMEAECLRLQGKWNEALETYLAVRNPTGKDFSALSLLRAGQAAAQLKQWQQSLAVLSEAVEKYPQTPAMTEILFEQAWALRNLGRTKEAVRAYEQVIAATDGEVAARAQFMLGQMLLEQKRYAEAVKTFYQVLYGYNFPAWQAAAAHEAARCYEALNDLDHAEKLYRELIEKYPASDQASPARQRLEALGKRR